MGGMYRGQVDFPESSLRRRLTPFSYWSNEPLALLMYFENRLQIKKNSTTMERQIKPLGLSNSLNKATLG